MDLLIKPINSFSFEDIVAFCKLGEREGVQLDYKGNLTTGSLSKHIAAFANSRGGIIIVGVVEDKITGLPITFKGIPENAQDIETIRQWVNNVDPLPKVIIYPTNVVKGKRFILIRIYEGDDTPYYVHNKGGLWIRTDNISKELTEIASPDYAKLLYKKSEEAKQAREFYITRAHDVVVAKLREANKEKNQLNFPNQSQPFALVDYFNYAKCMLEINLQPNYPGQPLTEPNSLEGKMREYQSREHVFDPFPSDQLDAIPDGVGSFSYDVHNVTYFCDQIFSQGLLFNKISLLRNQEPDIFYLDYLMGKIVVFLKAAQKFYRLFGYQGTLKGNIVLEHADDFNVFAYRNSIFPITKRALLSTYSWKLNMDTNILFKEAELTATILELAKSIYWDIGFKDFSENALKDSFIRTNLMTT